jgi:PEGA domain
MKKLIIFAAALSLPVLTGGCATVLNGTNQDVDFSTEPEGATINLVSGQACTTPCSYSMKRGDDSRVDISKDGYKSEYVLMQSRTGGSTFGNILAGGIIGGVVDASNGASNHLYPNPVYVRLVPTGSSEKAVLLDKKGKVIITVDEYNDKVRADVEKGLANQGKTELKKEKKKK